MEIELFKNWALDQIGKKLLSAKQTIAIAESVTSGMIQLAIGSIENATHFYQGGITCYNIAQKYKHLHIEPITALDCNCVSAETARQMAVGATKLFRSDWGIAITGYASPVTESENTVFAYYAIVLNNTVHCEQKIQSGLTDPFQVQMLYTRSILNDLLRLLNESKV